MRFKPLIVPNTAPPPLALYDEEYLFAPSHGPVGEMMTALIRGQCKSEIFWFRSVRPKRGRWWNPFERSFYFEVPDDHVIWTPSPDDFQIIIKGVPVKDQYGGTDEHEHVDILES